MRKKLFALSIALIVLYPVTAIAAPTISNIRVLTTSSSVAVIAWNTDLASTTEIEYGVASVYESTIPINYTPQTGHTVTLENLLPSTTYKYIVKSTDSNGERTVSPENTFSTSAGSTTTTTTAPTLEPPKAPIISNILASPQDTFAIVSWDTDKPSDSFIEFGTTNSYGNKSFHDYSSVLSHSIKLENLTPETEYHYIIKITGLNGLPTVSADKTFTTPKKIIQSLPSTNPTPQNYQSPSISIPQEEKIVLPYGVKEGQIIKFRKNPAIYLVKHSGLYPFANMNDYRTYVKKSKQRLKTLNGDGGPYTKKTDPANI